MITEGNIFIFNQFSGSFSVLKYLIGVTTRVRRSDREENEDPPRPHPAQYVINCFLCAWFITGIININNKAHLQNIKI